MSAVILQDQILHYEVLGRGRPMIFLHSWVGSWRYWIPVMQAASITFRAYALDLWGFGDSAKNPEKYPIDQQVCVIEDFMDKMGIPKIAIVGHGLGAIVALHFATKHTDWVDRIMAIGYPLESSLVSPRLHTATPVELADWLLSRIPSAEPARIEAPKADPQAITASLNNIENTDLIGLVQRLNTSCLFVHGQNDPAVQAPADSFTLPERSHQIIFEQSGHFPMLDESTKFNRLLADFLALASGVSPQQLQLKEEWKRRVR